MKNSEVDKLVPDSDSRKLQNVSCRAVDLFRNGDTVLSSNWDLKKIQLIKEEAFLKPLLLRDTNDQERVHGGEWYIQDGLHRLLKLGMKYIIDGSPLPNLIANCATNRPLFLLK